MGFFSDIFDFVGDIFSEVIEWFVDIPDVPDYEDSAKGALVNKQSNLAQIPVVYGQRLVGGTRVFVETSGTDNQYLYIALVLCEGEVQSIGNVYINDTISTDSKFSGLVSIEKMLGTDSQAASAVLTPAPSWTTNHRLRGIAYLAIRLKWDRDVFGSLPDITAVVNGRKVYDPRSGLTYYSNNPALCLLDYMRNTRYGKGLPNSAFESNWQSWKDAADVCEYEVDAYDDVNAPSVQIFNCNAVIDTSKPLIDNVKILLSGMQGLLTYSQGKYRLVVEDEMPNGYTPYLFDEDNILGSITVNGIKKRSKYNRVVATFANPEKNWQQDQVEYPEGGSSEYTTLLAEDDNFEMEQRASLDTVTSVYQARNIAYTLLKRSRNNIRCSFMATIDSIQCEVGDIVNVRHKSLGWGYDVSGNVDDPKPFRITGLALQPDGNVGITLAEHQDSIYAWYKGVEVDDYPDTTLPDPFSVVAVNQGTLAVTVDELINDDGSAQQRFSIDWTEPDDNFISEYVVQYKESTVSDWNNEVRIDAPPVYVLGVKSGVNYNVRVKAINSLGVSSAWTETASAIAATALTSRAGIKTFYQDEPPTGALQGDLWFDTNDDNHPHVYEYNTDEPPTLAWISTLSTEFLTAVGYNDLDASLKGTIDGKVETWFQASTIDPSTAWTDDATKDKHLGDMWWKTDTNKLARYKEDSGTYSWEEITDAKATSAFNNAATAQDTADGKRRVFVAEPTAPYDVGDLWDRGSTDGIWRCNTARASGYTPTDPVTTEDDWQVIADKTGDNTAASITNQGTLATASSVSENEISLTNNQLADIETDLGSITAGTIQVGANGVNIQSASTGSRITISSSKMEVYDGTTLRVKIGDLS